MPSLSTRDLERNEVTWWSNWATVTWFGENTWVMVSEYFDEYFLNRGGFLECDGGDQHLQDAEMHFAKRGTAPHFFVQETCGETLRIMQKAGYQTVDSMIVMALEDAALRRSDQVSVEVAKGPLLGEWVSAYLLSFYGNLDLTAGVRDIIQRLDSSERVTLLTGRVRGRVAGALALFRSPRLLGVYCVGTLPEFRRMGVTATLLDSAREFGSSEGRRVILQTILSDGYENYYSARGFKRVYAKTLLKKGPGKVDPNRKEG